MGQYVFDQAWEQERERLAGLEGWMDPGTIRHFEQIGVARGWHCLEVGAGGGSIASWLCERVAPDGRVLATDLDTRFLDAIEHPCLEMQRHDVTADPLPEDGFDLVHMRFLLMHLADREKVLERLVAALKPGGWLLVEDLDNITHVPVEPVPAYERVTAATMGVMAAVGVDIELGRKLPGMLEAAGLTDGTATGRIEIGHRENNPGVAMWRLTLTQLREPAVGSGAASDADFDEVLRLLDDPGFQVMPPAVIAAWARKP